MRTFHMENNWSGKKSPKAISLLNYENIKYKQNNSVKLLSNWRIIIVMRFIWIKFLFPTIRFRLDEVCMFVCFYLKLFPLFHMLNVQAAGFLLKCRDHSSFNRRWVSAKCSQRDETFTTHTKNSAEHSFVCVHVICNWCYCIQYCWYFHFYLPAKSEI